MDVDQRLTRLEADMAQMRDEWTVIQQAPLIQGRLLTALRTTQLEHSLKLDEHSMKLDEHSRKFDEVTARLDEHSVKLDLLANGQELIVGMLTTLIDREPGDNG